MLTIDECCYGYEPAQSQLTALRAENERLKDDLRGPAGFATWKDAALSERMTARALRADAERLRNQRDQARARIAELEASNAALHARVAELVDLVEEAYGEGRSDGLDSEYREQNRYPENRWENSSVRHALNRIQEALAGKPSQGSGE